MVVDVKEKRVVVANPHGFCSGVRRAIETVNAVLSSYAPPVYCLHEIVHNQQVVNEFAGKGVCFVEDVSAVPEKATLIFSAHGVSPDVRVSAVEKKLNIIDATCPFVSKVHAEAVRYADEGRTILIIGHGKHDEVAGVAGEAPDKVVIVENEDDARRVRVPDPNLVGVVCQTTLSADFASRIIIILKAMFPSLKTPSQSDVCYATQNRQNAVGELAKKSDVILVLGSRNSANSRRLVEVAENAGRKCFLIGDLNELDDVELDDVQTLGITSGASTPEFFLRDVLERLASFGFKRVDQLFSGKESPRKFSLPAELKTVK